MRKLFKYLWRLRFIFGLLAFMMISLGLSPEPVRADISFGIEPTNFALEIDPGGSETKSFRIENTGAEQLPITIKVYRFEPDDSEDATPQLVTNDANPYGGKVKLEVTPAQLILEPNEQRELKLRLSATSTALPGSYLLALTPEYTPSLLPQKDGEVVVGTTTKTQIVVPVVSLVKGKVNLQGTIEEFTTGQPSYSASPVDFRIKFANPGAVHYTAKTTLVITKGNRTIETVELEPKIILPGTSRLFTYQYTSQLGSGKYQARAVVSYGTDFKESTTATTQFQILGASFATMAGPVVLGLGGLFVILRLAGGRGHKRRRRTSTNRRR